MTDTPDYTFCEGIGIHDVVLELRNPAGRLNQHRESIANVLGRTILVREDFEAYIRKLFAFTELPRGFASCGAERLEAVCVEGPHVLELDELLRLAVDPVALAFIREEVLDSMPQAWDRYDPIEDVEARLRSRDVHVPTLDEIIGYPEPSEPPQSSKLLFVGRSKSGDPDTASSSSASEWRETRHLSVEDFRDLGPKGSPNTITLGSHDQASESPPVLMLNSRWSPEEQTLHLGVLQLGRVRKGARLRVSLSYRGAELAEAHAEDNYRELELKHTSMISPKARLHIDFKGPPSADGSRTIIRGAIEVQHLFPKHFGR